MEPLPYVAKAYSLRLQEEKQRELRVSPNIDVPMVAAVSNQPHAFNNHVIVAAPHQQSNSGRNFCNKPRRERPRCSHCGKLGHTIETCYALHGYPARTANVASTQTTTNEVGSSIAAPSFLTEQYHQLLSLIPNGNSSANLAGPTLEEDDWSG
ncbi:uncharacterized protein LOC143864178 [Tasmannia lanceolata]|uniref:uncharacterized protein LOC143864178 n=1 Tax=Tasmannia lanceolata TaxID=3420 RepID=UPI004062B28E